MSAKAAQRGRVRSDRIAIYFLVVAVFSSEAMHGIGRTGSSQPTQSPIDGHSVSGRRKRWGVLGRDIGSGDPVRARCRLCPAGKIRRAPLCRRAGRRRVSRCRSIVRRCPRRRRLLRIQRDAPQPKEKDGGGDCESHSYLEMSRDGCGVRASDATPKRKRRKRGQRCALYKAVRFTRTTPNPQEMLVQTVTRTKDVPPFTLSRMTIRPAEERQPDFTFRKENRTHD